MIDKSKKILITSALPYVNNVPHLGNIIGSVLSADIFARFCRSNGLETLYVCGSDEHGTATETKAKEENTTPRELCDKYFEIHKSIYEWFDISFDVFGRTSKENHHKITQDLFKKVEANDYVEEKTLSQPFCSTCNSFLADRFIEGTCPHCGYEDARGDQCDGCGKLLNPSELVKPRCKVDGTSPEFKETTHLFLKLDKLQPILESWFNKQSEDGKWTQNAMRTTNAWFKEGLKPRAISRDLKWGIKIPDVGIGSKHTDKVFYVWFDAPIGYISITEQLLGDDYKNWWLDAKNTRLYQFMGKDNIPFHSIIFPGSLLAANKNQEDLANISPDELDYTTVHHLDATEYLNYEHTKFSKSRNIGVFGNNAKDSGIPADIFRYVLLYNRPESADTQFTWKSVQERLNNELVANFGNFVNRTLSFTNNFLDATLQPLTHGDLSEHMKNFHETYIEEIKEFVRLMEHVKLREALSQFMKISSLGNGYFQEAQPWKTKTNNKNKCEKDIALLANIVKDLAIMIEPYMPSITKEIFTQLNLSEEDISSRNISDLGKLSLGHIKINSSKPIFTKLEDSDVVKLQEKYGGTTDSKSKDSDSGSNSSKKKKNKNKKKKEKKPVETLSSSDIDIRVGKIVEVKKHPDAEKLYIETVDLGDKKIEIVSGLVGHYELDDLLNKQILVVTNLAPAKLRGVKSYGMLLAAEDENKTVGLVLAPDAELGSRVLAGMDAPAKDEISFEEFMTLKFALEDGNVFLNEGELVVDKSSIFVDKDLKNGTVR